MLVYFWVDKWKFDQFVDVNIISKVYRCCLSGHRVAVFGGARRRRADPTRHVSDPFRERGRRVKSLRRDIHAKGEVSVCRLTSTMPVISHLHGCIGASVERVLRAARFALQ